MNIAYTHRFTDRIAKREAVRQNTRHMMYLFWWDNVPNHVRENSDMQDYTKDMILEFETDLNNQPLLAAQYLTRVSDYLTILVADALEHFEEINS